MATTGPRPTHKREASSFGYPLKAGASINRGAVAALEAGWLIAGKTATGLTVVGIAADGADNAAGGDVTATVERGAVLLGNSSASDLIAAADVGADCYLVDDETVAKTNGGGTRSRAGLILAVEATGVWVDIDGRR